MKRKITNKPKAPASLSQEARRVLSSVFRDSESERGGVDVAKYRNKHRKQWDALEALERDGYIRKDMGSNRYFVSMIGLAQLSAKPAKRLLANAEKIFLELRKSYTKDPQGKVYLSDLASRTGLAIGDISGSLPYMLEMSIWSGHNLNGEKIDVAEMYVTPSETVVSLKYRRFRDLILERIQSHENMKGQPQYGTPLGIFRDSLGVEPPRGGDSVAANSSHETWPKAFDTAFDTYEVVGASLGEGGAGRVFPVANAGGERFALKCLAPERITTERRKRFKNEISFCGKSVHRNIVQVLDSGLSIIKGQKCPFYVMPEFPMTLRKLLHQGVAQEKVLPLFGQILDGIDAAHKLKSFHRDLKPENILYQPTKDVLVIADFGIAHFEEDMLATQVETRNAGKMANLGYSSPEQRTKGSPVDHRADIFALGLILNEMFTGSVPHGTGYKIIGSVAPDFAYLDPLVEQMIQNDPNARPQSVDAIKRELIARGNEFIALQRVDALTKEIVPQFEAGKFDPIKIVSTDWNRGQLIIELSRVPEPGWMQRFRQPHGSWGSIMGSGPESFQFGGSRASVPASEQSAEQILGFAKQYVELANSGYQSDLDRKARQEEHAYREKLQQEQAAAEARARVLGKLKV